MNQPSVLHLCTSRSWGGMEMIVCRVAQLQQERGHKVSFACDPGSSIRETCRACGVATVALSNRGYLSLGGIAILDRVIGREQPDILHVQYSKDLNLAIPANWRHGKKVVLTKQIESVVAKKDPWHRLLYGGVSRATGISTMIRDNLIATTPLAPEQVDLVHLGVDINRFKPDPAARRETRCEMGVPGDALAVGMMGRMSPGKGFDDFLAMAAQVEPRGLSFVLIGGYSRNEEAYGAALQEKAHQRLGPRAHLTGYREDRQRYLNALDIFLFPSHAESFGLALVEAMATGLPCVAYSKGGVLDIITDCVDGLFARHRDITDLAGATRRLTADPALRVRLGRAARETVISRFTEQRMLAGFEQTYRRALAP